MPLDDDWPFPAAYVYEVRLAGGESVKSMGGLDEPAIQSYLNRFGCVPVHKGFGGPRKLARLDSTGDWVLSDLNGATPFEARAERMLGRTEQVECLIGHDWFSIGYSVHPSLLELSFEPSGDGFSRFMLGGFEKGAPLPAVHDAFWRYVVTDDNLCISWDEGGTAGIKFDARRELRAATNIKNGSLTFFEATLSVSDHFFPPGGDLMKHWPKEYWGVKKS